MEWLEILTKYYSNLGGSKTEVLRILEELITSKAYGVQAGLQLGDVHVRIHGYGLFYKLKVNVRYSAGGVTTKFFITKQQLKQLHSLLLLKG